MSPKEALDKIKELFNSKEEVKVELKEAKLSDGAIISYDNLEIGSVVNLINEDATVTVLPDGDYTLEDGTTFSIKEGVVAEPEAPEAVTPVEEAEVVADPNVEKLVVLEERIAKLEEVIAMITENMTEVKHSQVEKIEELETKLTEVSLQPVIESITKPIMSNDKKSTFDLMSEGLDMIKKSNKK